MDAKQTPLIELLERVPQDARVVVEHDQFSSTSHPVGRLCHEAAAALRAALAEPEQEPVAWMWRCKPYCNWPEWSVSLKRPADSGHDGNKRTEGYEDVPLYTAPTPRKPLSEEEIVRLMVGEDRVQLLYAKPGDSYFSEFAEGAIRELVESARAIEKAHGIGGGDGSEI